MQTIAPNNIPVVILAGGLGSRLGEATEKLPKPMMKIGEYPIIVHIMKLWHKAGVREFYIAGGYKVVELQNYFYCRTWDDIFPDSSIVVVDTGLHTQTAGRILNMKDDIGKRDFGVSYGDGLTDFDLSNLINEHLHLESPASMLLTHPKSRFGEVEVTDSGIIRSFTEKPMSDKWINAGFFMLSHTILDFIHSENETLEFDVFPRLAKRWLLSGTFQHEGFWQCMDTPKELRELNELWEKGNAPWTG